MDDFKRIIKMKTGGSVNKAIAAYEKRERKSEEKADIAQDKAIVKKAFAMHDKQEHSGEKTDLSKLKKGGRSKKKEGTVRKYKAGGNVTNVYEAKKDAGDKDNIRKVKNIKPKKLQHGGLLQEPGKPAATAAAKMCKGGKMRKYAEGSSVVDFVKDQAKDLKEKILGTPEQNRIAQENLNKQATAGSKLAKFFGGKAEQKCSGGRMRKKYAEGGSIDDDVRTRAMKWLESGSPAQSTGEVAKAPSAAVAKKPAAKTQPESDREEYSPWMREIRKQEAEDEERKRESASLAAKYPEKRTAAKMVRDEAEIAQRTPLETKGARLFKSVGMRRGGKACK